MADITHLEAEKVIDACTKKATEVHTKMDIGVVDDGGNLQAFLRMDGGPGWGALISQLRRLRPPDCLT
jgi:uncharacterized protein GlcG (DUF336 family)